MISATIGFAVLVVAGAGTLGLALGGAIALGAMLCSGTLHAPAAATALVVIAQDPGVEFILVPVLVGSLIFVSVALVFNNLSEHSRYPIYWR